MKTEGRDVLNFPSLELSWDPSDLFVIFAGGRSSWRAPTGKGETRKFLHPASEMIFELVTEGGGVPLGISSLVCGGVLATDFSSVSVAHPCQHHGERAGECSVP